MTRKTATPSALFEERGIALSKRVSRSLGLQLLYGAVVSLLAAVVVFAVFLLLGGRLLDRTVYGQVFVSRMADRQFETLQEFVKAEGITRENLYRLNAWCSRSEKVYLTLYMNDAVEILYESPLSDEDKEYLTAEMYDPELENPEREYALLLCDGVAVRAFLYYYAGDAYYYWTAVIGGVLAFLTFSGCFIALVRRKLAYIMQLKRELDILAGGDLNYLVSVRGQDELGELASGIDQMRRSILNHQAAEERMRAANSQLITAMSHDLRTPLTSLLAYLELMQRGKYDGEEQLRHFIDRCLEKTLRIKSMADKLFEYYRMRTAEWERPESECVDADETFLLFWNEYAFSLESSGFAVARDFQELHGTLEINLEMLRRAFDNLYSNLLKYADAGQPVFIAFHREEKNAVLTVENSVSARRDAGESTGIGLKTCGRILRTYGGSVQTQEQNGRFLVQLTLPMG